MDSAAEAFDIGWCRDQAMAPALARFFVAHAPPAYISHAELQGGRADDPGRWAEDLERRIVVDVLRCIGRVEDDASAPARCALVRRGGVLAGFALVGFVPAVRRPYAVLEDLLIDAGLRAQGAGAALIDWIAAACRARGAVRLFLESGRGNHDAHRFFHSHGFEQTSIVMMRDL